MKRLGLLVLLLLAPAASAHVEILPGQGASLAEAIWLGPKPPAIQYDAIPEHGGIRYYTIDLKANETVHFRFARSPASFSGGIPPSLAIMGPGLDARGFRPTFLEFPPNASAQVHQGVQSEELDYDPIAAVASGTLVELDFTPPETARYAIAVFDEDQGGDYLLQVGEFAPIGLQRHFGIPRGATEMRTWEGQSWAHTSLPTALTLAVGALLAYWWLRGRSRIPTFLIAGVAAAVLIAASGASYAHQAVHHAGLGVVRVAPTAGLALAHAGLAAALLWIARRAHEPPLPPERLAFVGLGILGVLLWAGFFWGPTIAVIGALFPEERARPAD